MQNLPISFEFFERFYDNPENLSPEEIIQKMQSLGNGPNRNKRFFELASYSDVQITKEQWIKKYTTT